MHACWWTPTQPARLSTAAKSAPRGGSQEGASVQRAARRRRGAENVPRDAAELTEAGAGFRSAHPGTTASASLSPRGHCPRQQNCCLACRNGARAAASAPFLITISPPPSEARNFFLSVRASPKADADCSWWPVSPLRERGLTFAQLLQPFNRRRRTPSCFPTPTQTVEFLRKLRQRVRLRGTDCAEN